MEQLVGGRASAEKIEWNDKNKELFDRARTAAAGQAEGRRAHPAVQLEGLVTFKVIYSDSYTDTDLTGPSEIGTDGLKDTRHCTDTDTVVAGIEFSIFVLEKVIIFI